MKKKTKTQVQLLLSIQITVLMALAGMLLITACRHEAGSPKTYGITTEVLKGEGLVVSSPRDKARKDANVTVTVMPKPEGDWGLEELLILESGGLPVNYADNGDNTFTFKMPGAPVKAVASFKEVEYYGIKIHPTENGGIEDDPAGGQYETFYVTLNVYPDPGYELRPGSPSVMTETAPIMVTRLFENGYVFKMPGGNVTVNAEFMPIGTATFAINKSPLQNGSINVPNAGVPGDDILIMAIPANLGFAASAVSVTGNASGLAISAVPGAAANTWVFTMPEESVTVSAVFTEVPAYSIDISITGSYANQGTFTATPAPVGGKLPAGIPVTLQLKINNAIEYEYKDSSFDYSPKNTLVTETAPGAEWTFLMPAEPFSASVEIQPVPNAPVHAVTAGELSGGTISFISGVTEGKAREGARIVLQANPAAGYEIYGEPFAQGAAIAIEPVSGMPMRWTFLMPEGLPEGTNIVLGIDFKPIPRSIMQGTVAQYGTMEIIGLDEEGRASAGTVLTIKMTITDPEWEITGLPTAAPAAANTGFVPVAGSVNEFSYTVPAGTGAITIRFPESSFTQKRYAITSNAAYTGSESPAPENFGALSISGDGISPANLSAVKDAVVTITATPRAGYQVDGGAPVVESGGNHITLEPDAENSNVWTFIMPGNPVAVTANFTDAVFSLLEVYKGSKNGLNINSYAAIAEITGYGAGWNWADVAEAVNPNAENQGRSADSPALSVTCPEDYTNALGIPESAAQVGFAIKANAPLLLNSGDPNTSNNITGLSFWVRGTYAREIAFTGFGENNSTNVWVQNINVNDTWQRVIVPVPNPSKSVSISEAFVFKLTMDKGQFVYIDDIEFITSGVTLAGISIPSAFDQKIINASPKPLAELLTQNQVNLRYTVPGGQVLINNSVVSGFSPKFNWNLWFDPLEYIVEGAASLQGTNVVPNDYGVTFTVQVKMGSVESNKMLCKVEENDESFAYIDAFIGTINDYYRINCSYEGMVPDNSPGAPYSSGRSANLHAGKNASDTTAGRNIPALNIAGYNYLIFWVWSVNDTVKTVPEYTITLYTGGSPGDTSGPSGTAHNAAWTFSGGYATGAVTQNGYHEIKIPLSVFGISGTNVTGWSYTMANKTQDVIDSVGGAGAIDIRFADIVVTVD